MTWMDKPWGKTRSIYSGPLMHADEIEVAKGGYCSIHAHSTKINIFHVRVGILMVRQFTIHGDRLKCNELSAGSTLVVPAGILHQFWARHETQAVETYLPVCGLCDPDDIDRHPGLPIGGIAEYYQAMESLWSAAFRGQVCMTK